MYTHRNYRLEIGHWATGRIWIKTVVVRTDSHGHARYQKLLEHYAPEAAMWDTVAEHLTLIRRLIADDKDQSDRQADISRSIGQEDDDQD